MNAQRFDDDDALMQALTKAVDEEPPEHLVRVALGAPELVGASQELANIDYDSLFDEAVLTRAADVRSRSLTIEFDRRTLEVEIVTNAEHAVGRINPPDGASVTVAGLRDTSFTTRTDDAGRFSCRLPDGPVQIRVDVGGRSFATPWITR